MTWVQGVSQWGTLAYDLTRVIAGEVPDGNAVTVAAADRWVRDQTRTVSNVTTAAGSVTVTAAAASFTAEDVTAFFTAPGVPAATTIGAVTNSTTVVLSAPATATATGVTAQVHQDAIRTPDHVNVDPGDMPNRCGYFASIANPTGSAAMCGAATPAAAGGYATALRVTAPFTGAGPYPRWLWRLVVSTANTVPGNYSTAVLTGTCLDLDGNTSFGHNSTYTPNAAGVFTGPSAGLQVAVSDPSGLLTVGTTLIRGFSTTYPGGVDLWPMLPRAAGDPVFATPPPGVKGTDWDISRAATQYAYTANTSFNDRGSILYGLGIKTVAALTGARYTVKFPLALGKCRIFPNTSGGALSLDVGGGAKKDEAAAVIRLPQGARIATWARLFTTAATPAASTLVRYRMSVTADGIVAVFDADPGFTGKQATAYYCRYSPADTKYEALPMVFNWTSMDYTTDTQTGNNFYSGVQHMYWPLRRRQDGTAEGVRDWQTGWMRCEPMLIGGVTPNMNGNAVNDITNSTSDASYTGSVNKIVNLGAPGMSSSLSGGFQFNAPARQAKPAGDGRWCLYPVNLAEGDWYMSYAVDEGRKMRGTLDRFCYLPDDGWLPGDELTDLTTGTKWLLLKPDYMGTGSRVKWGTPIYGGVAIKEA